MVVGRKLIAGYSDSNLDTFVGYIKCEQKIEWGIYKERDYYR